MALAVLPALILLGIYASARPPSQPKAADEGLREVPITRRKDDIFGLESFIHAFTDWTAIDVGQLRRTFGERMSAQYRPGGAASLFERAGGVNCSAICRWAECGDRFADDLVTYLNSEFDCDPKRLGQFLLQISNSPHQLNLDSIRKLYPNIPALLGRIAAVGIDALSETREQAQVLTTIRDGLAPGAQGAHAD